MSDMSDCHFGHEEGPIGSDGDDDAGFPSELNYSGTGGAFSVKNAPYDRRDVWVIRIRLQLEGWARDLVIEVRSAAEPQRRALQTVRLKRPKSRHSMIVGPGVSPRLRDYHSTIRILPSLEWNAGVNSALHSAAPA